MQYKLCKSCGKDLPLTEFYVFHSKYIKKNGELRAYTFPRTPCKSCNVVYSEKWKADNQEKYSDNRRKYSDLHRKNHHIKKIKIIELMGGKCTCCGSTDYWNLTFDHIIPTRNSANDRRYRKYKKDILLFLDNVKKREKFQLLCYGCNISKGSHKSCKIDHTLKISEINRYNSNSQTF